MLTSKQTTLKPLLESEDGVHLTAYLVNRNSLIDLRSQLRTIIDEASECLELALPVEERKKFLEPLQALLTDARIFKQMKGNVGIFRNREIFRVLNIPIEIQQSYQLATSFHVKPLLRWLQGDQEFLLLGLDKESAHLYFGSQDSFKHVGTAFLPNGIHMKDGDSLVWLNDWIADLTKSSKPRLFLSGDPLMLKPLKAVLRYRNTVRTAISDSFESQNVRVYCQEIRKILKQESEKSLAKALLEFRFAEEGKRAKKNIFQISKAVVQGRVRKLIVTDELNIFGRIDKRSGGLAIHPFDMDHEDDCILDDLAQIVLSQGGEVVIAKRDEIPNGRPILAILDGEDEGPDMEQMQYDNLQERFG